MRSADAQAVFAVLGALRRGPRRVRGHVAVVHVSLARVGAVTGLSDLSAYGVVATGLLRWSL